MSEPRITGMDLTFAAMGKAWSEDAPKIADGLRLCAEKVFSVSQYYCPLDRGPLRASGRIVTTGSGLNASTTIEYGGDSAPYAMWVHEDLTKHHDAPTCAKWLERAYLETENDCLAIMKRSLFAETAGNINGFMDLQGTSL